MFKYSWMSSEVKVSNFFPIHYLFTRLFWIFRWQVSDFHLFFWVNRYFSSILELAVKISVFWTPNVLILNLSLGASFWTLMWANIFIFRIFWTHKWHCWSMPRYWLIWKFCWWIFLAHFILFLIIRLIYICFFFPFSFFIL